MVRSESCPRNRARFRTSLSRA